MPELDVQLELKGTAAVLRLAGNASASRTPNLEAKVRELIVIHPPVVVVDLAEVAFISSTAIAFLAHLQRGIESAGGKAYLARPQPQVREVIDRCRIGDLLPMIDDPEAVLKECAARPMAESVGS